MNDPQQPYEQTYYPKPPRKDHKGLWIVLGVGIGVLVVLIGIPVAYFAFLGISAAEQSNRNLPSASLSPTLKSQGPPASKIVMRFIWFGADFSAPIQQGDITVYAGGKTFQKKTTSKGWFVLDGVPCDQNAKIVFGHGGWMSRKPGESPSPVDTNDDFEVTRYVSCSDKPVGLGTFSWEEGKFVDDDMDHIDGCFTCQ